MNFSIGLLTAGNLISSEQVVRREERNAKAVATVFLNNPISEVPFITFVKCYLFEACPVSSTNTDGEEIPQRHENRVRNHYKSSQPVYHIQYFPSVQFSRAVVSDSVTPWTTAR